MSNHAGSLLSFIVAIIVTATSAGSLLSRGDKQSTTPERRSPALSETANTSSPAVAGYPSVSAKSLPPVTELLRLFGGSPAPRNVPPKALPPPAPLRGASPWRYVATAVGSAGRRVYLFAGDPKGKMLSVEEGGITNGWKLDHAGVEGFTLSNGGQTFAVPRNRKR